MSKNYSLMVFATLIAILFGAVWFHTGSMVPPSGEDAIWFHAGLFTLLIGAFIVEYRFTKPNDVFVNCLVVFASTSTLTNPPHPSWWALLRWGALSCGIVAMFLAWDPGQDIKTSKSKFRAYTYQIVTQIGRAEVIFSFVFLLALISYFDLDKPDSKIFATIWAIFLLAAHIDLSALGRLRFRLGRYRDREIIAITHSFLAPSIVFCRKLGAAPIRAHDIVGFCQTTAGDCHCFGVVIGERSSATETRIVVALLNKSIDNAELDDRSLVVRLGSSEAIGFAESVSAEDVAEVGHVIGTVTRGTSISQVRFELFGEPRIAAGSLLRVKSSSSPVFYQVFDGVIDEEETLKESTRAFVEGKAEQVGCWDSSRGGFETHDWVATERGQVKLVDQLEPAPPYALKASEMCVGKIPNSNYAANIDVNDLVLFHTGILGVTGSGKSFLTFNIVEECATKGIKAICIDPTGDYQRYLHNAVLLTTAASIRAFLNSSTHMVGIIETATASLHAIELTELAARNCLAWCKENRHESEILVPKPKVLMILEEAHLLVPEWNSNPQPGLRDKVSATSQIVLQARKYGLGFLVVSQRTANVVKTILNQCNTIISFQAFDETGFDFLKNYMGSFHVQSLPNLKSRHGLVVGKASRSRRPVMVHFNEQIRTLCQTPATNMPIPSSGNSDPSNTAIPVDEAGELGE